jgi:hypothetical protein
MTNLSANQLCNYLLIKFCISQKQHKLLKINYLCVMFFVQFVNIT